MAEQTGKTMWDFIEKNWPMLLVILIVLILLGIGISLLIAHINKKKLAGDPAGAPGTQPGLTYPPGNYSAWADALEAAMDYATTDETAITEILEKMQTDPDVSKLANNFGIRIIDYFNILGLFSETEKYNLWSALQSEGYTGSYADNINQNWAYKGITYKL